MLTCPNCSNAIDSKTEYCPYCDAPVGDYVRNPTSTATTTTPGGSGSLTTQLGIAGLNNRTVIAVGIVIAIIGVALIIISPSLFWEEVSFSFPPGPVRTTDLRAVTLLFGAALLVVGGIISAVGFSQLKSTEPTTAPAPTTQPVVTQPISPKSVKLGNTPDEVQSAMGQPDKIINLGVRVIHVYRDMKIIYDDGKVSDVQLS